MGYFKAEKALLSRHPVGPTARWVVPFNRDSGNMRGTSSIYGERKRVRKAMYMATLSAVRWNISLHEFYVRLVTKGKRKMVALIACARKLLIRLNSLLATAAKTTQEMVNASIYSSLRAQAPIFAQNDRLRKFRPGFDWPW